MQSDKTGAKLIQNIQQEMRSRLEEINQLVRQAESLDNGNVSLADLICFHLEEASKDLARMKELTARLKAQTV